MWDLRELDVDELVIESRDERNDRKDRRLIIAAQKACTAPPGLTYRFSRPQAEPGLWLPDAIAGAVSASLANDAPYLDLLGGTVEVIHLRS